MSHSETFICEICEQAHPVHKRIAFDGATLCKDCYAEKTTICACCGSRIWLEDAVTDEHTTLCLYCYDDHFTRCSHCDAIIRFDEASYLNGNDDEPYCEDCAARLASRTGIQSYYYKPDPIFYGKGNRFFGVELEIDYGGEYSDSARKLLAIANGNDRNDFLYIKHDGSLEEGMELVTHPMTLEHHQNFMPWESILNKAVSLGYRSHQTSTCGLHVHVNRDSLGDSVARQEETIARILFFVENHWNELLRFSRRTQSQMEQWAARYGRKDSPKEQLEHAKGRYLSRYTCVNLLNSATIEFRLFRGTLRYNTLIATLQLVNELCEVAFALSDEEMSRLTWSEFVARIGTLNDPELVQYLKERRLFVSEPVVGEEEL